jgi:hypothetical protein
MKPMTHFSPGVRERAVRLVREPHGEHESPGAANWSIAAKSSGTVERLMRRLGLKGAWHAGQDYVR